MLLHKIQIIPTAVPVTKPKQNLGEKSLRHSKTNKISINFKQPLNHHEDFLGFVQEKTNEQNSYSKLLKTLLIRIQRENVWICSKKKQ